MPSLLDGLYVMLVIGLSPWLAWSAWKHGKYRDGWRAKWLGWVPPREGAAPCVWLHAVSLGEVNLLGVLITEIRAQRPGCAVYVTTTTRTGFEAARRRYTDCQVAYCPLDFSWAVRSAVRRIRPNLLVLAELEIWPQLIGQVKASGAAVAVVNGRLSPRSFRGYRRVRWFFRDVLRSIDRILVQSEEYAERFRQLGANPDTVQVTGSLKFDGARTERNNPQTVELLRLLRRQPREVWWVAGSTFEHEEQMVLEAFQSLLPRHSQLRLMIVPRHPERFEEVANLCAATGVAWVRRSQLTNANPTDAPLLFVDAMGELGAWWALADVGYVGGSMGTRGGQNMIEPAAFGVPVCFGPHTVNFRDVSDALLRENAAEVVRDGKQLAAFVEQRLSDPHLARRQGERARQLVLRNKGAVARTWSALEYLLPTDVAGRANGGQPHRRSA